MCDGWTVKIEFLAPKSSSIAMAVQEYFTVEHIMSYCGHISSATETVIWDKGVWPGYEVPSYCQLHCNEAMVKALKTYNNYLHTVTSDFSDEHMVGIYRKRVGGNVYDKINSMKLATLKRVVVNTINGLDAGTRIIICEKCEPEFHGDIAKRAIVAEAKAQELSAEVEQLKGTTTAQAAELIELKAKFETLTSELKNIII